MDPAAIAAALIGAQMGQQQVALSETMLRMNANAANGVAKMLDDAAQASMNNLANVASGIGANLNISV
jgi:hypothetical protein